MQRICLHKSGKEARLSGRQILLLAAILAALLRSVQKRQHRLSLYLATELVTTAIIERAFNRYGSNSPQYAFVYGFARPFELAAAAIVSRIKLLAIMLSLFAAWAVFLYYDWTVDATLALTEGFCFLVIGLSQAMRAPFTEGRYVNGTLAFLWCSLAIFDFAYTMNWSRVAMQNLNDWVPTALCAWAFFMVALFVRRDAPATL